MKLILVGLFLLLCACGNHKNNNSGGGGDQPVNSTVIKPNFKDFLGAYTIKDCTSAPGQSQEDNCKYKNADVRLETYQRHSALSIERSIDATDGHESTKVASRMSFENHPQSSCQISYGQSTCVMKGHSGSEKNITFTKDKSTGKILVKLEMERKDPDHAENDLNLSLILQKQ